MSVTEPAYAKVNLALSVGPPGDDGFHPLATVFHTLELHDDVTLTEGERAGISIAVSGPGADHVPAGHDNDDNLVTRALRSLAATTGVDPAVDVVIRKVIPVAGGMAGGSADAAAALRAAVRLWGLDVAVADLPAIAAGLGSDVPFCLRGGGTSIGTGRGELLQPVAAPVPLDWVLAIATEGLSTPAVYRELDRLRGALAVEPPRLPDGLLDALAAGDAARLAVALGNDLGRAAVSLRPELAGTLDAGVRAGALAAMVSGSGPTCLFLARDREDATRLCASLATSGRCADAVVTRSATTA